MAAPQQKAIVKLAIGASAAVCALAGVFVYLLGDTIGLDAPTAELVAAALLLAALIDFVLLRYFWDRLTGGR